MNFDELQQRNKILERRWKITLVIAILFVLSRPIALYVVNHLIHKAANSSCDANYTYISNTSVCNPAVISKAGYAAEQAKLSDYIKQQVAAKNITDASIFFRDLKLGPVWGINDLATYAPASQLKLPLAIMYLNLADDDQSLLQQKLSFAPNPPWSFNPYFQPSVKIQPNTDYTVAELLMHMLQYSDNDAYGVLQQHLIDTNQTKLENDTFLQLGILAPKDAFDSVINVRRYASIFTLLYNSSILNADHSEMALQWLTDSDFTLGLKAGVPHGVPVANKFGERILEDGATKQLGDCGIVYYPNNPYVLCVMVRGSNYDTLASVIANISKTVYTEVDSRKITQ